jgi:hypothetical protein
MNKIPIRKWVVVAVCESEEDMAQIVSHIKNDTMKKIKSYELLTGNSFKYALEFLPVFVPISRLMRRDLDGDNYFDVCIGTHIRAGMKSIQDCWALTFLIDRDLLIKHNIGEKFAMIVKNNYFKPANYSNHIICCFGGVPNNDMRWDTPSEKTCETFSGCNQCKNVNIISSCKHTCYHYMINLTLLDAWPRDRNKNILIEFEQFKPPVPYIY